MGTLGARWRRDPLRPRGHRHRLGQHHRRRALRRLAGRDLRGGHVRRHLPQRRLHPDQDVRLPRRPGPVGPAGARPRRRTRRSTGSAGARSATGSSAASTRSRPAGGATAEGQPNVDVFERTRPSSTTTPCDTGTGEAGHRRPDRDRRRQPRRRAPTSRGSTRCLPHQRHGDAARRAARAGWSIVGRRLRRRGVRPRLLAPSAPRSPRCTAAPGCCMAEDEEVSRAFTERRLAAVGRAARTARRPRSSAAATASRSALSDGDRGRGRRAAGGDRPGAATPTGSAWTTPGSRSTTAWSWSTSTSARPSTASGRWATSAATTSSSTWPTTRRASCSTTCCTPTTCVASDHRFVPSAVFTSPQIASVGLTEQQAARAGRRAPRRAPGLRRRGLRLGDGGPAGRAVRQAGRRAPTASSCWARTSSGRRPACCSSRSSRR